MMVVAPHMSQGQGLVRVVMSLWNAMSVSMMVANNVNHGSRPHLVHRSAVSECRLGGAVAFSCSSVQA